MALDGTPNPRQIVFNSIQQALVKRAAKEDKKKVEKATPARARKRA
jgi:hypothetical protein